MSTSAETKPINKNTNLAAEKNKDPIWNVISTKVLKNDSTSSSSDPLRILEIAGGSGIHATYFSSKIKDELQKEEFMWYPTDPCPDALASQRAYRDEFPLLKNHIHEPMPLTLDENGVQEIETKKVIMEAHGGGEKTFDMILSVNMVHISPWSATLGLCKLAGKLIKTNGILLLYGSYRVNGTCVESNLRFDEYLKNMNPGYGVRNLEDVIAVAEKEGLTFVEKVEMPANNLCVLLRKS